MKKLFMAVMAIATIAMVSCKGKNEPTPEPTPTPTPTPTEQAPEFDVPADALVIAAYIPDGICKDVYMEGAYEGWNIDPSVATRLAPVEGYANWYAAEIKIPTDVEDLAEYMGTCKILLSDADGNVPGDWSSQWNSDKVIVHEGSAAELVDDMGSKALKFTADALGAAVFVTINGWQSKPCVDYGVAKACKIKCANIFVVDEEDTRTGWNWADMEAKGNGVFTYSVLVEDDSNLGANIGIEVDGEIVESWYDLGNGESLGIAVGSTVLYTFTSENGPKGQLTIAVAN